MPPDGLNGLNGLNCLNEQRLLAERFGGLDEGLVSHCRRAIREKIETEPEIRKWFQDLTLKTGHKGQIFLLTVDDPQWSEAISEWIDFVTNDMKQ